jgi:hypothetical protein
MVVKKPITVRVEAELLTEARRCASQENRTLTNFIETVLRRRIDEIALERSTDQPGLFLHAGAGPADAA